MMNKLTFLMIAAASAQIYDVRVQNSSVDELQKIAEEQFEIISAELIRIASEVNIENSNLTLEMEEVENLIANTNQLLTISRDLQNQVLIDLNANNVALSNILRENAGSMVANFATISQQLDDQFQIVNNHTQQSLGLFEGILAGIGAMNDVLTTINLFQEQFEIVSLNSILAELEIQTTLLEAQGAVPFRERVHEVILTTEWDINMPFVESVDTLLDACVYDPLGFGPIECVGTETFESNAQAANLIPLTAAEEPQNKRIIKHNKQYINKK